ncbi:hypothetical protein M2139_002844 [Enterococcus sp. PF1-24]|uniref:MucBP domain-containing protein n=1 Tax=unclassified Enterococcus TaxID=2608891 RepID=UPI002472FF8F|nr:MULTISPECIES: MucBP domain-containing protein [unclassified Enterococcus]MDH6365818.1 hypothetical protein [Enterococcus sp. PFB1-1]MDH6402914.1 hypothetical protein [Enterococcus sp. PF1-24]
MIFQEEHHAKKISTLLLSLSLVGAFSLTTITASAEDIAETTLPTTRDEDINSWMPDTNLQQLVLAQIAGLTNVNEITPQKMAATTFEWTISPESNPFANVSNFKGLEEASKINITCTESDFNGLGLKNYPDVQAKMTVTFNGRLQRTFPNGIDFSTLSNYHSVNMEYSSIFYSGKKVYLNGTNYSEFFISFEELGLTNFSNTWLTPGWDATIAMDGGISCTYIITATSTGFQFVLEETTDFDYFYLAGKTFINRPNATSAEGPDFYIELDSSNNVNLSGYISLPVDFDFTGVTAGEPVTVEYWEYDSANNPIKQISTPVTLNGNFGERYSADIIRISGYAFTGADMTNNLSPNNGTFTNQKQTVKLSYQKLTSGANQGLVLAQYQDENNKPISEDILLKGETGTAYATTQKDISGYTFKEIIGNKSGTFSDGVITVTYVYTSNGGATDPSKPGGTVPDEVLLPVWRAYNLNDGDHLYTLNMIGLSV